MNAGRYEVRCAAEGCQELAQYKIAAEWSDGTTSELKTYGLACEQHLAGLFRRGHEKRSHCRIVEGESLSPPRIFRLNTGCRDRQLQRAPELEAEQGEISPK